MIELQFSSRSKIYFYKQKKNVDRFTPDVTSLLSGTSIKAVISYVTDYIAKPTLKTYQIFATAYNVFDRNANLDVNDSSRTDDARKLILKIVNALSSKMELGSPMASMYLLQNPDHYTSHKFIPFWWKSFVNEIMHSESLYRSAFQNDDNNIKMEDKEEKTCSAFLKIDEFNVDCVDIKAERALSEAKTYDVDMLEANEVVPSLNNMNMDIDCPPSFIGGGSSIFQRTKVVYNDCLNSNMESDDDVEDRHSHEIEYNDGEEDDDDDEGELEFEKDPNDEKLLISQDGNNYVASSKVDDYKYRPEVYISSSLYEWAILSVKERISQKNDVKTSFHFLPGHGQRNTHIVKLIPSRSETFLLNFIGGPLPRYDQGDFEYYCCYDVNSIQTMGKVARFKRWAANVGQIICTVQFQV